MATWRARLTRAAYISVAVVAVALIGLWILFRFEAEPFKTKEYFGRFIGKPHVVFEPNGRDIRLLQSFVYIDPSGTEWIAPENSVANGASIPEVLWSIAGAPLEGLYRDASLIHDAYCPNDKMTWEQTHLAFYYAMRASGVPPVKAKVMFYAVMVFGPKWTFYIDEHGKKVLMLPDSPTPTPTTAEIRQVEDLQARLLNGEDISIEVITTLAIAAGSARAVAMLPALSNSRGETTSSQSSGKTKEKAKKNLRKRIKKRR